MDNHEHAKIWRQAARVVESMSVMSEEAERLQREQATYVPPAMSRATLERADAYRAAALVLTVIAAEYEKGA